MCLWRSGLAFFHVGLQSQQGCEGRVRINRLFRTRRTVTLAGMALTLLLALMMRLAALAAFAAVVAPVAVHLVRRATGAMLRTEGPA